MKKKTLDTLGDAPIEPEYIDKMIALAQVLQTVLNGPGCRIADSKTGFVLMAFDIVDGGRANYIANCDRRDVITMLKEQLARFEGMPEAEGHA